jgi:hypothetical protein
MIGVRRVVPATTAVSRKDNFIRLAATSNGARPAVDSFGLVVSVRSRALRTRRSTRGCNGRRGRFAPIGAAEPQGRYTVGRSS